MKPSWSDHEWTKCFLRSLYLVSICVFLVVTKCGQKHHLLLFLTSAVAHVPVVEDFFSSYIRQLQNVSSCHMCTVLKKNLSNCTRTQSQNLAQTKKIKKFNSRRDFLWAEGLKKIPLHLMVSIFIFFPLSRIYFSVYFSNNFWPEPLDELA